MGLDCFACGRNFSGDINALLRHFKQEYEEKGIVRYFYKTKKDGSIKIVRESSFKEVFKREIKPNFKKGAEYAHISEFKGL